MSEAEWCLIHGTVKHYDRRSGFDICDECEGESELSDTLMVVCDEKHPHFGCTGYLTGEVIEVLGEPMALIQHPRGCEHGIDGFYVKRGQARPVSMRRKNGGDA